MTRPTIPGSRPVRVAVFEARARAVLCLVGPAILLGLVLGALLGGK